MRALIQCVSDARVLIDNIVVGQINKGCVIFLGIGQDDSKSDAKKLWNKIYKLRMFEDNKGKINKSLSDILGQVLIVSQFSLYADCTKGNRPSFDKAQKPRKAEKLYSYFIDYASSDIKDIQTGKFGALMDVTLTNHGPFTLFLDSENL